MTLVGLCVVLSFLVHLNSFTKPLKTFLVGMNSGFCSKFNDLVTGSLLI